MRYARGGDAATVGLHHVHRVQALAADAQPGMSPDASAARDDHLGRNPRRGTGRAEQLGGRPAAERSVPPGDQEVRGPGQEGEIRPPPRGDVHVREKAPDPGAAQLSGREQTAGEGVRAAERSFEHVDSVANARPRRGVSRRSASTGAPLHLR